MGSRRVSQYQRAAPMGHCRSLEEEWPDEEKEESFATRRRGFGGVTGFFFTLFINQAIYHATH